MTAPPASREEATRRVREIVAEALRREPAALALDAPLASLGAESMDVMSILLEIEDAFDVRLADDEISGQMTLAELADHVFARSLTRGQD